MFQRFHGHTLYCCSSIPPIRVVMQPIIKPKYNIKRRISFDLDSVDYLHYNGDIEITVIVNISEASDHLCNRYIYKSNHKI